MGDPYILMLVALAVLAIVDLVVGVSNDAVNFLNSANYKCKNHLFSTPVFVHTTT